MSNKNKIYELRKQLNNVLDAYRENEYQVRQYRELVNAIHTLQNDDHEYLVWQPNEENHLESLTCPVVIPAEWLRSLIDEAYMKGMLEAYRLRQDFPHHN